MASKIKLIKLNNSLITVLTLESINLVVWKTQLQIFNINLPAEKAKDKMHLYQRLLLNNRVIQTNLN